MDESEFQICVIIGLALIIGGGFWGIRRYVFLRRSLRAQGMVVEQFVQDSAEQSKFYYPVVEFRTESGETVQFRGGAGNAGGPQIQTGTTVDVLYDPSKPSQAQINSFVQYWLGPLGITVMGLVIMAMGVFFYLNGGGE
ncbi:MAG: DUF3592 domain-containing protein [Chlorobiales bacterium]|nr:DUF3592 domain-containing protein [Chlorobiales bacterium]